MFIILSTMFIVSGNDNCSPVKIADKEEISSTMDCHNKSHSKESEENKKHDDCKKMDCCTLTFVSFYPKVLNERISFNYLIKLISIDSQAIKDYKDSIFRPPIV